MKIMFLRSKPLFFYDSHKSKNFDKTIKNIIVNHLKSFFLGFWARLFVIGWMNEQFLKKNFVLKFGHFDQKMLFFAEFFFDPTHFLAGNRQTGQKNRPNIRNIQNLGQKIFCDHPIKIHEKIWKNRPPLESPPGGGVFLKLTGYLKGYLACRKKKLFVCRRLSKLQNVDKCFSPQYAKLFLSLSLCVCVCVCMVFLLDHLEEQQGDCDVIMPASVIFSYFPWI